MGAKATFLIFTFSALTCACATDSDLSPNVVNQNASPISLPAPTYPTAAVRQNLSGTCDVRFDIDPRGHPQNIAISCDHDVFEYPTREAVDSWRYNPRIVAGEATWRNGVETRLDFSPR